MSLFFLRCSLYRTIRAGVVAVLLVSGAGLLAQDTIAPPPQYASVVAELRTLIEHELKDKQLPAISVALVDDQRIVWAEGFGYADPEKKLPATAETIYRVGSVSKLFTDIGMMQLVEKGQVNLDAPVQNYIPDFHPKNPFDKPITLRELMSHRAGLVREPPVGHYFDNTNPSLQATVVSMNNTELVYPPGEHTKYSNAGIASVGYVLQSLEHQPFPAYLKQAVLGPLGLKNSAFEPEPQLMQNLAKSYIWTYDGRTIVAPTFQLGIAPAGSMYTNVLDLGRFISVLFAGGHSANGQVIKPETLEQMWTPQFAPADTASGFGIGFGLSRYQGYRVVGHNGAIYGFATDLEAIPDEKLGVIVVTTMDSSNSVTSYIAKRALSLALAQKEGKPIEKISDMQPIPVAEARVLEGRYTGENNGFDLYTDHNYELWSSFLNGGERYTLRKADADLIVDGRLGYGAKLNPTKDGIELNGKQFKRVEVTRPVPIKPEWRDYIGEYGWDYDTLYILEHDGKLNALIEWYSQYPLAEVAKDKFEFPPSGLYDHENLSFVRDSGGKVIAVKVGQVVFKRRAVGTAEGVTFKIHPVKPVSELRQTALAQQPPHEDGEFWKPDLVEVKTLDPTIKLDIRYATSNNFAGTPFYQQGRAFMQRQAAEALVRASHRLNKMGYGFLIHDSYRPWYVTKMFWDGTRPEDHIFVANPSEGSRHNRGEAVDLTIYDLKTGREVPMVGGYDEFSPRSFPEYPGGTSLQRWDRALLRRVMEDEGFRVYEFEWWHFDYKDWKHYPILNLTFEQLVQQKAK